MYLTTITDDLGAYYHYCKEGYREYVNIGTISYQSFSERDVSAFETNLTFLSINKIETLKPYQGDGTRLFRKIFEISWKGSDQGRLHVSANNEALFFFFKMGFIPTRTETPIYSYVPTEVTTLRLLNRVLPFLKNGSKLSDIENFDDLSKRTLEHYLYKHCDKLFSMDENEEDWILKNEAFIREIVGKKILHELKTELYPKKDEITDEQLLSEQSFIDEVVKNPEQKVDLFQRTVVPVLLKWMSFLSTGPKQKGWACSIPGHFPNISMELSPEGIEQWKADIEGKKKFVPFRKLEQIQRFMTEQQVAKLNEIFGRIAEKNPTYFEGYD